MKSKTLLLAIIFLSFSTFFQPLVNAESETGTEQDSEQETNLKVTERDIKDQKQGNVRENLQKEKEVKKEVKKIEVEQNKKNLQEKRETFKETLQAEKEKRKNKIEEMRKDFKEKRDDFKVKIQTIKDERKKQLTEKVDNRMTTVNKNQTSRMTEALAKLTDHINKLQEKFPTADLSLAKTAVSTALAAVEQQAVKDYAFSITDEKNLGQSVKASYDLLAKDLKSTQALLVKAKEAVVTAYGTTRNIVK